MSAGCWAWAAALINVPTMNIVMGVFYPCRDHDQYAHAGIDGRGERGALLRGGASTRPWRPVALGLWGACRRPTAGAHDAAHPAPAFIAVAVVFAVQMVQAATD